MVETHTQEFMWEPFVGPFDTLLIHLFDSRSGKSSYKIHLDWLISGTTARKMKDSRGSRTH